MGRRYLYIDSYEITRPTPSDNFSPKRGNVKEKEYPKKISFTNLNKGISCFYKCSHKR